MWLERFASGQTTPSGTSQHQWASGSASLRPVYNVRAPSSSTLVSNNSSTASLPLSTGRAQEGSSLKHEVRAAAEEEADAAAMASARAAPEDPLTVLQRLLDPLPARASDSANPTEPDSDVMPAPVQLPTYEEISAREATLDELHQSIQGCDEVLNSVDSYLSTFSTDLSLVSGEIESLQARSTALGRSLQNRTVVEQRLGPMVESVVLPPALVREIVDGAVDDDAWTASLQELADRVAKMSETRRSGDQSAIARDLVPLVDNLVLKAVERIRDYLVLQIKGLRSATGSPQPIQSEKLVKRKYLYHFLRQHHGQLADDILQAYINTMRWHYLAVFTRYEGALRRLKTFTFDRQDLLGAEEVRKGGGSGGGSGSGSGSSSRPAGPAGVHDAFSLGRRAEGVKRRPGRTWDLQQLESDKVTTHHLETAFQAFEAALADTASWEYGVLSALLPAATASRQGAIARAFALVFEPTFALGRQLTRQLIGGAADAIGVLICVRLTQETARMLQRRRVPVLEGHINATLMLLWPRLQQVMDSQCDSIRAALSAITDAGARSGRAPSTAPLPLTQRVGRFTAAILALSADSADDEPVARSLTRLTTDFDALLVSAAARLLPDDAARARFLENNAALLATVLDDIPGRLADAIRGHWKQRLR